MSNAEFEALRAVVADESLSLVERKQAAEHYVAGLVDAVPAPAEDDAEVVELVTPWKDDGPLGGTAPMAWRACNEVYGWHKDGPTLAQARKRVHNGLRLRVLLGVAVDTSAHRLTRLEVCRVILDEHLDPRNFYRVNSYTPEQMLAKVMPASATKYGGWNKPPVPVTRPPMTLADVW
jgi:hypothetical protein